MEMLENRLLLSANILLIAEYVGSYDASDNWLGILDFSNPANDNPNYVHKIEVRLQANEFADGQDIGALVFDVNLGSHLTMAHPAGPWVSADGLYDSDNDGTADTQLFELNKDDWTPNDLKGIWVRTTSFTADNRQYGETPRPKDGAPDSLGYPTLLGSFEVKWDGISTELTLSPNPPTGAAWTTFDNNSGGGGLMEGHNGAFATQGVEFVAYSGPMLTISDASGNEGDAGTSDMVFTINLSSAAADDVTFDFATSSGTAVSGVDFHPVTQAVTIPAGQLSATVAVPVIGDTLDENTETFTAAIGNATNAGIARAQAVGTIYDDDGPPGMTINDVSVTEGNSGTASATFTITLSAVSGRTVTANYATTAGTATAGVDYQATSGTLTFNPGQTIKTVNVLVNGDTAVEPDETFHLVLSNVQNAALAAGGGLGTILNDDHAAPTDIALSNAGVPENQPVGTVVGVLSGSDPDAGQSATLTFSLVGGYGDNALFSIDPATNHLKTAVVFNYETRSSYGIKVRAGDTDGLTYDEAFTISVTDVNEQPVIGNQAFGPISDSIPNGTIVGTVAASDPDIGQSLTYSITAGNVGNAFAINPTTGQITVASSSALNFEVRPSFALTVLVTDNGTPVLSRSATIAIDLMSVNDAPINAVPGPQAMNEDAALIFSSSNGNAITIADTDANGGLEQVTLTATGGTLTLGTTAGLASVSGNGTGAVTFTGTVANLNAALEGLTFQGSQDAYGVASVRITTDDQGHSGAGGPQSDTDTVAITIYPVNDAPSFTKGPDQTVDENAPAQAVANWATGISAGPANEASQTVAFQATNDNNGLFAVQPAIAADGTLTYTLALNANGTATVTAVLKDNGGTLDGGVDASSPQAFTITVNHVNAPPEGAGQSVLVGDDGGVIITLSGTDLETPSASLQYSVTALPAHGTLAALGGNLFRYDVARDYDGSDTFEFTVTDSDGLTSAPVAVAVNGGIMRTFDAKGMLQFFGSNLALGKIRLKGGTGAVFFGHSGSCDIGRIFLDNTTPKASLTISVKNKGMFTTVLGGIDSSGPLSKLSGTRTTFSGPIRLGAGAISTSMKLGRAVGASVVSGSPIKLLSAGEWARSGDASVLVQAPSLRKLAIKGDFAGDLDVDVLGRGSIRGSMVGSRVDVAGSTGKFNIKGNLLASRWDVLGDLGKFAVGGTADSSTVRSDGTMLGVSVGASNHSDFLAGVGAIATRTPTANGDFANASASIKSFAVKGIRGWPASQRFFSDSNLSAANLGKISLLNGDFAADGIYYSSSGTVRAIKHTDKADRGNNWTYPPKPEIVFAQPDVIHVL